MPDWIERLRIVSGHYCKSSCTKLEFEAIGLLIVLKEYVLRIRDKVLNTMISE